MVIKPVLHRILVKPDEILDNDPAYAAAKRLGMQLSEKEMEREQGAIDTGVVIMMGPTVGRDFGDENFVQVGERVVYAKYGGKAIVHPKTKERFIALNDEDVIAIFKED